MRKRAEDLQSGDRISIRAVGGGGTVIRTSAHPDPDRIRVGYRYGPESWQKTITNLSRDEEVEVVGEGLIEPATGLRSGGAPCPTCGVNPLEFEDDAECGSCATAREA